ncbi:MAG: hypothetical protein II333_06250, partial [Clostridia bacterium]|nr:hypothetical protein [Clostridia bacterium]
MWSWVEFLITLALMIAAVVLLYKAYGYLRAFVKRAAFFLNLKKICRRNGYSLMKTAPLYHSVFFRTTRPELLIETGEGSYSI